MRRTSLAAPAAAALLMLTLAVPSSAQRAGPVGRPLPTRAPARVVTAPPRPAAPTRADTVSQAYRDGAAMPGRSVDGNLATRWTRAAMPSQLSHDEMVSAWVEIAYAAFAYDALLGRVPTGDELRRHIAELRGEATWRDLWKQLATSPERDRRYGFFAPAPLGPDEVTRLYGIPQDLVSREGEQCFGGTGPNCDMPKEVEMFAWTYPKWHGAFTLPDGTRMAYVDVGVTVGSILHDNMCLQVRPVTGHFCGLTLATVAGEFAKNNGTPVALEWNKAFYNVRDRRGWTATFGPYPIGATARHGWYDDLRPAPARPAKMAPVLGMLTVPVLSEAYQGPERRGSTRLTAPRGTKLDQTDVAYCKSKAFSATSAPPLFAPEGTCR